MSKVMLSLLLGVVAVGNIFAAHHPFVDGAEADVCVKVVDDLGEPVGGASVSVVFMTDVQKVDVVKGTSDAEGSFRAARNCIGEIRLEVRKEGYYDTKKTITVFEFQPVETTAKSRRWKDGSIDLGVVLKKKRHPIRMAFHAVDFKPFPATNEVLKLDLETLEWCPPFGSGRHDDLHLVFDGGRNPLDWDDFHEHLKVSFPNCVDGFYELKSDATSAFRYAHQANADGKYARSLEFRSVHTRDGLTESTKLPADTYLIYRVRTETNELGQVVHAHYGRIGEKFRQNVGLSLRSWFNPTANDTNLEDARPR